MTETMSSTSSGSSADRGELRRRAQLQRASMKVATETPAAKPLFEAPVKVEPPPDDHIYRKTQETLGKFSWIRQSMLSSQKSVSLLGIPKGPQTPVLNKTAESVWASKFPANGQLPPQKSTGHHRPKQSGHGSGSERRRSSKSPDKRSEVKSNHRSSHASSHGHKSVDKPDTGDKKRHEEQRSKESDGTRSRSSDANHERRKSSGGSSSKRPSVSPQRKGGAKEGQSTTGHSHSNKAGEPHSKPAHSKHEVEKKSPPAQPDSSSVSVKMEASSTKDDAFQMPAPLSTAPGSSRPSHSGGKTSDRGEDRPNGLLATGGKKEGGEKELTREDVKRKLKLHMPDTSEEARLNTSGGLKSAGTEKVEIILKEMTEVGPPLTGIHTPIKTEVSKFPFPNQDAPGAQLSHTKRKAAAESGGGKNKPMGPSSELKKYFLEMSDSEDEDDQVRETKTSGRNAQKMRSPARQTPMLSSGSSSSSSGSEDSSDSDSDGSSSSDESVQNAPPPASPPKQESDTTNWGLASFVNPVKRDSPGNTFPLLVSASGTSTPNTQTSATLPMGLFGGDDEPCSAGFMTTDSHGFDVNDILPSLDSKELDPEHKDNYSATKINGLIMKISKNGNKGGPEPKSSNKEVSKKSSQGKSPSTASRNSSKTATNRTPRKGVDKKPADKPASASNAKGDSEKTKANSSKAGQSTPSNKTNWAEPSPKTERATKTAQGKKSSDKKGKRTPPTSSRKVAPKSKEFVDSDSESDLEVDVVNISPEKGSTSVKASPSPRAKSNNTSKPKARDSGKKAATSSSSSSSQEKTLSVDVLSSDNSLLSPLNEPLLSPIEGDLSSTVPKITYGNNGIPKSLIVSIDLSLLDRIPTKKESSRQGDSKKSGSSSESKPRSKTQKRKRDSSQSQADAASASATEEVQTKRPKKEKETDSKATPTRSLPTPTRTLPTPTTSLSTPTRSLPTPTRTPTQATPTRTTPTRTPPSNRQDTEKGGSARRSSVSSTSSRLSEESTKTDRSGKRRKVERQTSQDSSKKKEKKSKKTPKKQVPSRCQDWDAPPVPEHSQNGVASEHVAKSNGHAAGSQWGDLASGQQGKTWERHDPRGDIPYFNSKTDVEDRPLSADHYLTEAKNLKHLADGLADKNQKTLTYVDAVLYFIQCGNAMESDPHLSESKSPSTMYLETVDLIKFILRFNSHHMHNQSQDQTTSDKKLAVLCLRCQSLLYMKLFKLKKDYAMKYSKALTDHFKNPPKNTQVPSPYQHNWNGARGTGTPSPMSPTPSPAGSVTSVGSQGSNNGDLTLSTPTQNKLSNGTSAASSVTIPQRIHSLMQEHLKITNHLLHSQDLWEQANLLAQENPEFFRRLDQRFGPLTLHSTLIELVRYVRQGLQWLKES